MDRPQTQPATAEPVGADQRHRTPLRPPRFEAIARSFETGVPATGEFPSVLFPGRRVRLQIDPEPDGARVRCGDITSRVQTPADLNRPTLSKRPAEIALLDLRGVILSVNAAWRASAAVRALELANDGVGARYVDVCKAALPQLDETALDRELERLLVGNAPQMEKTYAIAGELRHVQITPLQLGRATYFIAIHEDLTERARVLAALNETSGQLLHAQEQERQRIAIELHDSMNQHLAAMVLTVGQLRRRLSEGRDVRAQLDDLEKLAQQATRETRVLSYLLNASRDEREPLTAALRRLVQGFGSRTELEATLETDGPVDAINTAVQHALFRVVQEALTNVHRHAQATKVTVRLQASARHVSLSIADDGRGMPSARAGDDDEAPLGVGIPGMRARIEQLRGTLDIASHASGTVVTAKVPARGVQEAGNR